MRCDLHLHTSKSDGVLEPGDLFEEIRKRALQLFCVTDHDCMGAYPVPEDLQARALRGLEVDSHHEGHTTHILAYGVDFDSTLLQTLSSQRTERNTRMQQMVERLNGLGIDICIADVTAHAPGASSLGRPHLARALVDKGHCSTVQDAFDRYIADDAEGYVALKRLSAEKIISLIHASCGIGVIAHPMRLREPKHLNDLIDLGIDGIEVIHPTATSVDEARLREIARRKGLLVTGGTDFHAPVAQRPLGVELIDAEVRALLERMPVNA